MVQIMDIIKSFRDRGLDTLSDMIESYPATPREDWSEMQKAMVAAKEIAVERMLKGGGNAHPLTLNSEEIHNV